MAFFFGANRRQKQPTDIARSIKDLLRRLWSEPKNPRVDEELGRQMAQMKLIVQGTPEVDCSPEQVQLLVQCIIHEDLLYDLARSIRVLPFEARKDVQIIFSHILRWNPTNGRSSEPAVSYLVSKRPEIIVELCRGYDYPESALPCGTILRQAIIHDNITAIILYDESKPDERAVQIGEVDVQRRESCQGLFWRFFEWIDDGSFEVSTDAFNTFRDILTRHKDMISQYLSANFDEFFDKYNTILMQSGSYVTKRQSIKLLGEILLDRANYSVMTAYVDSGPHLKLCMNLLKDDRKMVRYEGFHVFKVFVANPNKSTEVQRILINNREQLLKFLPKFLEDRTDDDQFMDEKSFLVRQIELLPSKPVDPNPQAASGVGVGAVA